MAQTARIVHALSAPGNGTSGSPWSLAQLQSAINQDTIGHDTVRFLNGRYEAPLVISDLHGTATEPRVFMAASGAMPVFSGSVAIPNNLWDTLDANDPAGLPQGTRKVHVNAFTNGRVHNLYEADALMRLAREPDAGWYRCDSMRPDTLWSDDISGTGWNPDTDTATLVLRYANWGYAIRQIKPAGQAGRRLAFSPVSFRSGQNDWGFYLQNKASALDEPGEWFVQGAYGPDPILYYLSPNGVPTDVRISVRSRGIEIPTAGLAPSSYLEFRGLTFEHFNDEKGYLGYDPNSLGVAVNIKNGSHHITLDDCTFLALRIGVNDEGGGAQHHITIKNCLFQDVYRNALKLSGNQPIVQDCRFSNIGTIVGQAGEDFLGNTAVKCQGDDISITGNVFRKVGGSAITAGGDRTLTDAHQVMNNHVDSALVMLNDHSAITFDYCDGLTVSHNVVAHMVPNRASSATDHNQSDRSVGIYYGNHDIRNTRVADNTITGCGTGILVDHSPGYTGNVIENNTVFNCRAAQIAIQDLGEQNGSYQQSYDTRYEGNVLYTLTSESPCVFIDQVEAETYSDPNDSMAVDFGLFAANRYFAPFSDVVVHERVHYATSASHELGQTTIPWSLRGRQQRWHDDLDSHTSPLHLHEHRIIAQDPLPISALSDDFTNGVGNWDEDACDPLPASDAGNPILYNNACWYTEKAVGAALTTSADTGFYRVFFRARSDSADAMRLSLHFDALLKYLNTAFFALQPEWRTVECIVKVQDNGNQDYRLTSIQDLQLELGARLGTSFYLDDVEVYRCTVDTTWGDTIALNHILRYNCPITEPSTQNIHQSGVPEGQPSFFTVPGNLGQCWSDVYGNFYGAGDPVPLDEWASIILFRMDVPDGNLALDGNNEHHITSNTTWSEHMNVAGSIVVDAGKTLTIDGAHIGFAESTPTLTTNLVVQPGGNLIVRNGASLRNWMGCSAPAAMWDGVKALGNGTTIGAGLVVMESGARITDALTALRCAAGQPNTIFGGDDNSGGIVQATNAVFENNLYDVVTRPHAAVDPAVWGPSSFTNCTFHRTRALHDPQLPPGARVSLMGSAGTPFTSCTFENTTGDYKGMGIQAIGTRVLVEGGEEPQTRSRFQGLDFAMLHSAYSPEHLADVDRCDFTDNKRGILIAGADNCKVTRSTFTVADKPVTDLSVEGAYGAYLFGCTAFELEENTFAGIGTEHPKVGLVLRNTGIADIAYYNNTFDAFADASARSCGTVIMGTNADQNGMGLRIKCNDYSASGTNDYDVAFTGDTVNIAAIQGALGQSTTDPAGNTFANVDPLTCDGNDARHLYEDVENALNAFGYWHHQPQSAVELVPNCSSAPNTNTNTIWFYDKPTSCPVDLSGLVPIGDDEVVAGDAHAEFDELKEVYSNWRDGGDTEGLIDFIMDPGNDSYAVRNRLMLVAPKVGEEAWKVCFSERNPALNPWHFAQALLANSPLEPGVLELLKQSDLPPFYKELVEDGQNGGTSMHSIYKSEIAHFNGVKSGALQAMVRKALRSGESNTLAMAAQALADYPTAGMASEAFALHLATGDLQSAREAVDIQVQLAGEDKDLWQVYDLWLSLLEDDKKPTDLDGAGVATLQGIAGNEGIGAAQAGAWLALLGEPVTEVVLLPNSTKRLKPLRERATTTAQPLLAVYPNPSRGPAYFTYSVAEGVDRAELRLHDAQGRLLSVKRLATQNGILELQSSELTAGVVLANLYWDGIPVEGVKLNVIR